MKKKFFLFLLFISWHLFSVSQPLSGYYIIGNSGNYPTINDAVNDLINNGVSGQTTFIIYNGNYYEDIIIPPIIGASSTNTITFRPKDNDSTLVHIIGSTNETITLDGADHINFLWLTIQNTNNHCVNIKNNADSNYFAHNVIQGNTTTSTSSNSALIYSGISDDMFNTFRNNHIVGGSYGIYLSGTSLLEDNTRVLENVFDDQYYYGIYLSYQKYPSVIGNILNLSNTVVRSIYLIYSQTININKNKTFEGSIMLESCNSQSGNESLISNNFVKSKNASGIVQSNSSYIITAYNSVYQYSTVQKRGAFYSNNCNNDMVRNNIFSSFVNSCAYYIHAGNINADYNDLYSNNILIYNAGTYLNSLNDWVFVSNNDLHSMNVLPNFFSNTDFHLAQSEFDGTAIPLSNILNDIDEDIRNNINPDIGADEFNMSNNQYIVNELNYTIYPNPFFDELYIESNSSNILEIIITDILGKTLFSTFFKNPVKKYIFNNKNHLIEKGIYLLILKSENDYTVKKLLLNKF